MSDDLKSALLKVERTLAAARAELDALGLAPTDRAYWPGRRKIMDRCAAALTAELGARITDKYDGCRVRIAGLASSGTSGLQGALQNWITAARRRLRDAPPTAR